jgi:hypothetical protein
MEVILSARLLPQNLKIKIYETWSLALREEYTMVFVNRVLRRIFRPKGEDVAGGWRRLRNVELHNLYASPNIIRVIKSRSMRWAVYVARISEMNANNFFCWKTRKEEPFQKI